MARENEKKLSDWSEIEPLKRVTDDKLKGNLVDSYNILWKKRDFAVLKSTQRWVTERDSVAYVTIGDELYAVHRTVCPRGDSLLGFLTTAPVMVDLASLFKGQQVGDVVELSPKLRKSLLEVLRGVQQAVVDEWVDAVKKTPATHNLNDLLRRMKPLSWDWGFNNDGLILPVLFALGEDEFSPMRTVLYQLMRREAIHLPQWCGKNPEIVTQYFGRNDADRRGWYVLSEDSHFVGSLRLDKGALCIVTNSTGESARSYVEHLAQQDIYGDIVLLEGPAQAVVAEAKNLSDYLRGIDMLKYE